MRVHQIKGAHLQFYFSMRVIWAGETKTKVLWNYREQDIGLQTGELTNSQPQSSTRVKKSRKNIQYSRNSREK